MNIVLFEPGELQGALPRSDPRARHILEVLRRRVGESFDAGVVDGVIGTAAVAEVTTEVLRITFTALGEPPPLPPVTLLIGMARPQTARDLLRDATTLGVSAMHFVATERSDRSYAQSSLWTSGEWRRQLLTGAAQAFDTRLPIVTWTRSLRDVLDEGAGTPRGDAQPTVRLALDNYEATGGLTWIPPGEPVQLAIGPERGWGERDRAALRAEGYTLVHLGARVLRVETACVAALAILGRR